jgi:hypothetical protein
MSITSRSKQEKKPNPVTTKKTGVVLGVYKYYIRQKAAQMEFSDTVVSGAFGGKNKPSKWANKYKV